MISQWLESLGYRGIGGLLIKPGFCDKIKHISSLVLEHRAHACSRHLGSKEINSAKLCPENFRQTGVHRKIKRHGVSNRYVWRAVHKKVSWLLCQHFVDTINRSTKCFKTWTQFYRLATLFSRWKEQVDEFLFWQLQIFFNLLGAGCDLMSRSIWRWWF